jgi:hypothetical protein
MNKTMINKETLSAIEEARHGKVERYESLESMWADLDNENTELNALADERLDDGQSLIRVSLNDL